MSHNKLWRAQAKLSDVETPWGPVTQSQLDAALSLYKDSVQRTICPNIAAERARHLERKAPAVASLLLFWIGTLHSDRRSWADLSE